MERLEVYCSYSKLPVRLEVDKVNALFSNGKGMEKLLGCKPSGANTLSHFRCHVEDEEGGLTWFKIFLYDREIYDPAMVRWDLLAKFVQLCLREVDRELCPLFHLPYSYETPYGGGTLIVTRTNWYHMDSVLWTREILESVFPAED